MGAMISDFTAVSLDGHLRDGHRLSVEVGVVGFRGLAPASCVIQVPRIRLPRPRHRVSGHRQRSPSAAVVMSAGGGWFGAGVRGCDYGNPSADWLHSPLCLLDWNWTVGRRNRAGLPIPRPEMSPDQLGLARCRPLAGIDSFAWASLRNVCVCVCVCGRYKRILLCGILALRSCLSLL